MHFVGFGILDTVDFLSPTKFVVHFYERKKNSEKNLDFFFFFFLVQS